MVVFRPPTSAAVGSKLVGSGGAAVAVPAGHVGSTLALPAAGLTHRAQGPLRVTLACWGERESKEERMKFVFC